MPMLAERVDGVIGVDTHRDTLTAAAVTRLGGVLAHITTSADAVGYRRLLGFAHAQLPGRLCWAVEGTGSFGAGLAGFLQQHGEQVLEVGRPKRPASRSGAKSDALDAVRAAREALGQDHLATPRRRGEREALRVLLTTRRCATLARVAAVGQLKALLVGAPEELRAELRGRSTAGQIDYCAGLRARPTRSLEHQATVRALRATAQRIQAPGRRGRRVGGRAHRAGRCGRPLAAGGPRRRAPERRPGAGQLVTCRAAAVGGGVCCPGRCVAPIPASSGQSTRYRLNRGGDRQLNRALAHHLAGAPAHRPRHPGLPGPPHR